MIINQSFVKIQTIIIFPIEKTSKNSMSLIKLMDEHIYKTKLLGHYIIKQK
jgi:hypothetical protein